MTGPEHYREAERLVDAAFANADDLTPQHQLAAFTAAQVHATLALAAATDTGLARIPRRGRGATAGFG